MREEDIDWKVYHLISNQKECSNEWLVRSCDYEPEALKASLSRLERYLLIEGTLDGWRACQLNEIILKQQLKDFLCDGIELSGGLIKYRPSPGEK